MIRSLLGVVDVARDAALAVGAYVGVLREHVKGEWATVLGGSFDERVEEAKARMEAHADMLADKEAEEEVAEAPDELWAAEGRAQGKAFADALRSGGQTFETPQRPAVSVPQFRVPVLNPAECRCPSCLDVLQAEQETSPAAGEEVAEPQWPKEWNKMCPCDGQLDAMCAAMGCPEREASAPGVFPSSGSDSSPKAEAAVGEPPEVEPSPLAPSGGSNVEWDEAAVDELIATDVRQHAAVVDALKLHRRSRRTGQCRCTPGAYLEHEYWYSHVAQHVMDALERIK